jgi:hypothetical protein
MDRAPYVALEGVDGSTTVLSGFDGTSNLFLTKGATGLDMLPWDVQVDEYPALDGEYVRAVRGKAREIFLPLIVYGKNRAEMISHKRRLLRALNPSRYSITLPKLIVADISSSGAYEAQREIEVYYASGMEGDEGNDNGLTWGKFGLVLRSQDPFFRDREDTVEQFFTFGEVKNFFPAAPNSFLSVDGVTGGFQISSPPQPTSSITVFNRGDVGSYPTWTIVGPLSGDFNLVRAATDYNPEQVLQIKNFSLASGQSATIVTEPGKLRASGSVGSGISWANLGANPQFWTIDPGENRLSITDLPEGVFPQQLTVSFRPKYLGV